MRCDHCPAPAGELCRGEDTPHFCRLVNPDDPIYTPAYIRILVKDDYDALNPAPSARPTYPPITIQIGNAFMAAANLVKAWWQGEPTKRSVEEIGRNLAICLVCPKYDAAQSRCTLCGCFAKFKTRLATEHCPLDPPKW